MSLALDFLREFFQRPNCSQADFARAAGMTATNVSDLVKGDVAISGRNMEKILRGFPMKEDKITFFTAYIRDETPEDLADDVSIQLAKKIPEAGMSEGSRADAQEAQLLEAFLALPSDAYRRRVVTLVRALRFDAQLRDLFKSTVDYIQPKESGQTAKPTEPTSIPRTAKPPTPALDAARERAGGADHKTTPVAPPPKPPASAS